MELTRRRRPGGVLSEKGALCRTGVGGQGAGRRFPFLVYSAQNRWPVIQDAGKEGVPREPLGLSKSESRILQHFVLLLFLSPGAKKGRLGPGWGFGEEVGASVEWGMRDALLLDWACLWLSVAH